MKGMREMSGCEMREKMQTIDKERDRKEGDR